MTILQGLKRLGNAVTSRTGSGKTDIPPGGLTAKATARMLRDTKSGALSSRNASLADSRNEVRRVWRQAAALAQDFINNSGRLKGAVDQIIADTVGIELALHPNPDLSGLGYSDDEKANLIKLIKDRWKIWSWDPKECDQRGKLTVPQMIDIGLRWYVAYGEVTGVFGYMQEPERKSLGITSGTKVCMVPPSRLVQETNETIGLFQGVLHDESGRPIAYRFREFTKGMPRVRDYSVSDSDGRHNVIHIFDPLDAEDVRGLGLLTPAFRTYAQEEVLGDVTLATAVAQSYVAGVLTSKTPSLEAFEALEAMGTGENTDTINALKTEYAGYYSSQLDAAKESKIDFGSGPIFANLGPDENFDFKTAATPHDNYLPYKASLGRETARALGITSSSYTMDYSKSTYSSVRMENASISNVTIRRRERIAAPLCQMIYENWLDEEIGSGRISFKGGYKKFLANRSRIYWAEWRGPARPTADDFKSERAVSERIDNGTSSIEIECAEKGVDPEELFVQRKTLHQRYVNEGMVSPYERKSKTKDIDPEKKSGSKKGSGDDNDENR